MSLEGKAVLVTGARQGLGKSISLGMAEQGADLIICDRVTDDGKTVVYTGTTADPMSGVDVNHRSVSTRTGDDSFTFEMYMTVPDAGEEMKVMEVAFTRVSAGG